MELGTIILLAGVLVVIIFYFAKFKGSEKAEEYQQGKKKIERVLENEKSSGKICMECGWENSPDNTFCNDCGSDLE